MPDDTANNSQQQQAAPDQAAAADAGASSAKPEGLPEGLPESFWDADAKAVKVDDLVKSYADLNKQQTDAAAALAKRPESPDKYELKIPETLELPEGMSFEFDPESDLAKMGRDLAYAKGLSQEEFLEQVVAPYVKHETERAAQDLTNSEEFYKTELSKLGENGQARIDAIGAYLAKNFTPEQAKAFEAATVTAPGVEALEKLINAANGQPVRTEGNGAAPDGVTAAKLEEMQRDPRYLTDPAFHKQVQDGYAKLYPGKQQRVM